MIVYELGNLHCIVFTPPEFLGEKVFNGMVNYCENILPEGDILFKDLIETIKEVIEKRYSKDSTSTSLCIFILQGKNSYSYGKKRLSPYKLIKNLKDDKDITIPGGCLSLMFRVDEPQFYKESGVPEIEYKVDEEIIICRLKRELDQLYKSNLKIDEYYKRHYLDPLICAILYLTKYHSEII